jgi:hypothetical protein
MQQSMARAGLAIALLVGAPGASHAITYLFAGDCDTPCGGVSGSISFADAALVPGNPYPAPTGFSFSFNGIEISDATALGFGLFAFPEPSFPAPPVPATVPADILAFGADIHVGETPQPSGDGGDGLIILLDGRWFAHGNAICTDTQCSFIRARGEFATGTGAWSTIPEPSVAWLIAAGLTVLSAIRWQGARPVRSPPRP